MKHFILLLLLPLWLTADEPIFFLSWTRDPAHTMTIVWLTPEEEALDLVEWKKGDEEWKPKVGSHRPLKLDEKSYLVHTVELTQLEGDTLYQFRIGQEREPHTFLTAPEDLEHPIKFFVGGDALHDDEETLAKMFKMIGKQEPLFAVVGGDIAYAFPATLLKREESHRWLAFLKLWQTNMVTSQGRVIPFIPVIGNHDVMGGFDQTPDEAQFFYRVFPLPDKKSFRSLDFGNYLSLILLDSGHTFSVNGLQSNWLKNTLQKRTDVPYLMTVYHVSSFPSFRPLCSVHAERIRSSWAPLFEEAKITASFEHHDHSLKRTHPIKNMKIDPDGIVYLGDGSMGLRKPRPPHTPKPWYIANAQEAQAVWRGIVTKEGAQFDALDPSGNLLDSYQKERSKPLPPPPKKKTVPDPNLFKKKALQVVNNPPR